jgi:nitrite reductase (NADH) large subunit
MKTKYLIVGNGIAGLSAAKEIRKNDTKGSILMVTKESYLTYWRMKLSELLPKTIKKDGLLINNESWYKENNIEVLLNKSVTKINSEEKDVILDDNNAISYDKLLIATGSSPFIPFIKGNEKLGVFALKTLDDLREIQDYLKNCGTVSVIGGGLLGIEAAWSLSHVVKKVNIIEFAPYLLHKQLDKEISHKLADRIMGEGINLFLSQETEEVIGDERVTGIRLKSKDLINTNAILISAGVRPNLELVKDTNIKYNRGIVIDQQLRTNVDDIYAAGDVAEVDGNIIGLWTVGLEQGKIAGANMSGQNILFTKPKLSTTLKIKDIQVFSAGDIFNYDRIYEYRDDDKDIHHKIYTKDKKIVGVILYGDLKEMNKLRNAVFNNINIEDYLREGLSFM